MNSAIRFHVYRPGASSSPDYEILLRYEKTLQMLQQHLAVGTERILGENLAGIYVHGSAAFGCFCWDASDFDYLIVVRNALTAEEKRALMDFTLELDRTAPPKGLEMSVVLLVDCRNVVHPVPFQLHYSHMHRAWYERSPEEYVAKMNGTDPDLAAYFAVIRQTGNVLYGPPIPEVFGEVPSEFVLDSFRNNVEDGSDDASAILNRCRYEAYRQEGLLFSKVEGGEWGLAHFPAEAHAEIRAALRQYLCVSYRAVELEELTPELFHRFNRHQDVKQCWRKEHGAWVLKEIAFTEEWGTKQFEFLVKCLRRTLHTGGAVIGAFSGGTLAGFASLENELFGNRYRYLQLSSLHVTYEKRGLGIGGKLFHRICTEAKKRGGEKLYISSHSSRETQAFYRAVGCREAAEYNEHLVSEEPCDCQLEFDLREECDSAPPNQKHGQSVEEK